MISGLIVENIEEEKRFSGAHHILSELKKMGITHFFMVPGKLINPLMSCFPKGGVHQALAHPIIAACETGVSYMAEGYARASENFGVCAVIGGPGETNALTGIASAYADGFPVLMLVGKISSQYELMNALQDSTQTGINTIDIFKPVTRLALDVKKGQAVPKFLRESIRMLKGNEPGPVYLGLSREALVDPVSGDDIEAINTIQDSWSNRPVSLERFKDPFIAGFPKNAKKFAILAGLRAKSMDVQRELVTFASKYNVPVATTLSAKGLFPEDHPLSLGIFGYSGNIRATNILTSNKLDGVVLIGVDTTQWSTMVWNPALKPKIGSIQVDKNPEYLGKYLDVTRGISADPAEFLRCFASAFDDSLSEGIHTRIDWFSEFAQTSKYTPVVNNNPVEDGLHPAELIPLLRKSFDRDGIVAVDSGSHRSFFGHYWEAYRPNTYLSATTLGPMGWSIPAGIGASFACPDSPCMIITGDGSMLMQGLELATASKYQRNVLFVVFNNSSYAASYFNNRNNIAELTEIPDYDWVSFANTFSIPGLCISSVEELQENIGHIFNRTTPFLLEIKCGHKFVTPNAQFAERMKFYPGL